VLRRKDKPDPTPARAKERTASRFYQLKSGHGLTGVYLKSTGRPLLVVRPGQLLWDAANARPPLQALLAVEGSAGPVVGKDQGGDEEGEAEVASGGPLGG